MIIEWWILYSINYYHYFLYHGFLNFSTSRSFKFVHIGCWIYYFLSSFFTGCVWLISFVYYFFSSFFWECYWICFTVEYSSRLLIPFPRSKLYKSLNAIKCRSPPKMYIKSSLTQIVCPSLAHGFLPIIFLFVSS